MNKYLISWPVEDGADERLERVDSNMPPEEYVGATWGSQWDAFVARGGRLTVLDGDVSPAEASTSEQGSSELGEGSENPGEGQGGAPGAENGAPNGSEEPSGDPNGQQTGEAPDSNAA